MEHPALVSVVIPNYNYGRFLSKTINSVLNQTYPSIEVIVVDDGSTDESRGILESFGNKITVYFLKNGGQAKARNYGIEKSKGSLIALLDSDDYWHPEKIEQQVRLINEKSLFNYTGITQFDNLNEENVKIIEPRFRGVCSQYFLQFPQVAIIPGGESSAMFSKELFTLVNGFNVNLETAAGRDFYRKISKLTEISYIREPLLFQRIHAGSMSKNIKKLTQDTVKANLIMFEDPNWNIDHKTKNRILLTLEWSFFKTWVKDFSIKESFLSLFKIVKFSFKSI